MSRFLLSPPWAGCATFSLFLALTGVMFLNPSQYPTQHHSCCASCSVGFSALALLAVLGCDRIRESPRVWFGMGLTDQLLPTPCCRQSHLPLAQVCTSPIQPNLEHFRDLRWFPPNLMYFSHLYQAISPNLLYRGRQELSQVTFPTLALWQFLSLQSIPSQQSQAEPIAPVAFLHAELIVFKYLGMLSAEGRDCAADRSQPGCSLCAGGVFLPL